jgi:hypothetical protein
MTEPVEDAASRLIVAAEAAAQRLTDAAEVTAKRLLASSEDIATERSAGTSEILRRLNSIDGRFERMEKVVLVGNGQPSLSERITSLEASQGKVSVAIVFSVAVTVLAAVANHFIK